MREFLARFDVHVSLLYSLIAIAWIILTDSLIALLLGGDAASLLTLNIAKALGFVMVTTAVLYKILHKELEKRMLVEQNLRSGISERIQAERELAALYNATSYLFKSDSLQNLGQQIVEAVVQEFEHADCGLMLVDKKRHKIVRLARTGKYNIQPDGVLTLSGAGLVPLAIRTGQIVYRADVAHEPNYLANAERTRSELVIPLKTSAGVIGVLDLQQAEVNAFSERDQRILTAFAERAVAAIENMQLYEALNHHAGELEAHVRERTAELQAAKERVEAILNNSADGISLIDTDFNIQLTNPTFDMLFGCSAGDCLGKSLLTLIHTNDEAAVKTLAQTVAAEHQGKRLEVSTLRQDGSLFDVELSIGYIKDSGLVCTLRDITERRGIQKALAEERNLLRILIDALPDFIYVKDLEHRFMLNNLAHARVLDNTTPDAVLGKTDYDYFPAEMAAQYYADEDEIIRTQKPLLDHEEQALNEDGSVIWASTTKIPLRNLNNDVIGIVGITRDISARKKTEQALQLRMADERQFQKRLKALHEITLDLALIDQVDDFYEQVIRQALGRLGFDRLALFLYDPATGAAMGTYGTDPEGHVVVEPGVRCIPEPEGIMGRAFHGAERFCLDESVPLYSNNKPIGMGWNAAAALWNGSQVVGWLVADNLISQAPASKSLMDVFALYALTVGALLGRKQVDAALQLKMEEDRQFQHGLKALHEITLDLALIEQVDDFYEQVIRQALGRLGFERMALFLYDPTDGSAIGTYGTDTQGRFVAEKDLRFVPSATGMMARAFQRAERFCFEEPTPLYDNGVPVAMGWNAAAVLWNGSQVVGWLVADNLVSQVPASKSLMDIFSLYALTVGALLGRKQVDAALRESEEKFRLLMEDAPEAIVITDETGRITLINAQAETIFGYQRDELIDQPIDSLLPETMREKHRLHRIEYLKSPYTRRIGAIAEVEARRKDGSLFPADIGLSYIHTSAGLLVMSFIMDITERKKSEDALRQTLEREIELGELKSRFVSMASHEFRTPLAVIQVTADTLEAYYDRMTAEDRRQRFAKLHEQIKRMTTLMDDVLIIGRLDEGTLKTTFEPIDLPFFLQDIVSELQETLDQYAIKFRCAFDHLPIQADRSLLRQIVTNLLSNAAKYSSPGSAITCTLTRQGDLVQIEVNDRGIGIPETARLHLFEPFFRGENIGKVQGTGLGLAITKRAVEAHRGTIDFHSVPGEGTTFTIQLPLDGEGE